MVSLTSRKISDDGGIPKILRDARLAARVSLEKISRVSLVPQKYLAALEDGHYWELPSQVFATQFFKAFCKCLNLNSDILMEKFENEYRTNQNWQERSEKVKAKAPSREPSLWIKRLAVIFNPFALKRGFLAILLLGFFSYIGFQVNRIIQPPSLSIDSPGDNLVTSRQVIDLKGRVEQESRLTINGQEVYPDKDGNFAEVIGLQPGINFINFAAKKKYSRELQLVRKVMVSADGKVTAASGG